MQKPARYIGCEDGAQTPDARAPTRSSWLLTYPDTYEIGLPNQGLQILYEILNERDRRRRRAGLRARGPTSRRCCAPHGLPLFWSTPTARPATSTCSPSTCRPSSSTRTSSNCIDLAGVPVRAADRGADDPLVGAGGHCTFNPEPLADFLDFVVLGDGEEVVGEITEVRRGVEGGGAAASRATRAARPRPASPASTCPSLYDVHLRRRRRIASVTPTHPDVPERVEKRTIADLADWPYPKQPARAAHRGRARPAQRRGVPRLHPRLPLLPGRHDHPPGARAAGRAGAHMVDDGPPAHRLRRGRAHVAVDRRLLAASSDVVGRHRAAAATTSSRCRCRACGSTRSPSASPPRSRRPAAPASPSRPRPARGACAR